MKRVHTVDEYTRLLAENPLVLSYVTGIDCGMCDAVKPKVVDMLQRISADIAEKAGDLQVLAVEIDAHTDQELAAQLSVFTLPAILFSVDGRELVREARYFSIGELEGRIQRYVQLYV